MSRARDLTLQSADQRCAVVHVGVNLAVRLHPENALCRLERIQRALRNFTKVDHVRENLVLILDMAALSSSEPANRVRNQVALVAETG